MFLDLLFYFLSTVAIKILKIYFQHFINGKEIVQLQGDLSERILAKNMLTANIQRKTVNSNERNESFVFLKIMQPKKQIL